MGFSRQKYWSGLPFPTPENLCYSVIEPGFPALPADSLPSELPGKCLSVEWVLKNQTTYFIEKITFFFSILYSLPLSPSLYARGPYLAFWVFSSLIFCTFIFLYNHRHHPSPEFFSSFRIETVPIKYLGFPGGSDSQESACSAGDLGLLSRSRRFPGEGNDYHSITPAWEILWTEESGRLQSTGL